jgi:guanylate kinase
MKKRGYDAILDIDVQGAMQLKHSFNDAVFIFILPPSMRILEQRLKSRMSDNPDEIFIVVNDDLKKALKDMESIITSRRLRTGKVDSKLIKNLK